MWHKNSYQGTADDDANLHPTISIDDLPGPRFYRSQPRSGFLSAVSGSKLRLDRYYDVYLYLVVLALHWLDRWRPSMLQASEDGKGGESNKSGYGLT